MKSRICHFEKEQIRPFNTKVTIWYLKWWLTPYQAFITRGVELSDGSIFDNTRVVSCLTYKELKYLCILTIENKKYFLNLNHHKCLSYLFPLHLYTYVMGLRPLIHYTCIYSYSAGIDFRSKNLMSTDVKFWRLKSIPALQGFSQSIIYKTNSYKIGLVKNVSSW